MWTHRGLCQGHGLHLSTAEVPVQDQPAPMPTTALLRNTAWISMAERASVRGGSGSSSLLLSTKRKHRMQLHAVRLGHPPVPAPSISVHRQLEGHCQCAQPCPGLDPSLAVSVSLLCYALLYHCLLDCPPAPFQPLPLSLSLMPDPSLRVL